MLYWSFDPNGTTSLVKSIESGRVIVDTRFEGGDYQHTGMSMLDQTMSKLERSGMFDVIGTLYVDSITMWGESIMTEAAVQQNRGSASPYDPKGTQIQDYGMSQDALLSMLIRMCKLPCDLVVIAHAEKAVNDITGIQEVRPKFIGKVYKEMLQLFDEVYYMHVQRTPGGLQRFLLTNNDGVFFARSRLASNAPIELRELPDIKAIKKKAGLPCEDLPPIQLS